MYSAGVAKMLEALRPVLLEFCGGICDRASVDVTSKSKMLKFWDDDILAGRVRVVTVSYDDHLSLSDRTLKLNRKYDLDSPDDYRCFLDDFAGVILDYVEFLRDLARDKGRKHLVSMWDAEHERLSKERVAWVAS